MSTERPYHFIHFASFASFKEISLKSDFIKKNHDLIHVYSSGAGGIYSPGNKVFISTENSCHFGDILLVSNHR